jgi:site-specific DNA recombinase
LVSVEDFEAAQRISARSGRGRQTRERERVRRTYVLRGLLVCGLCGRRMQGQFSHGAPYYRCRYPAEYALANHVEHPRNVYLPEHDVLPLLDEWLLRAFAPHRLADTVRRLHAAQPKQRTYVRPADDGVQALIDACDEKLARYRAIADAGGDPATVAAWIAETTAQRAAALARKPKPMVETTVPVRLSASDIERLVATFDHVRRTINEADPSGKGEVYRQLRLTLTFQPADSKIRVVAAPDADSCGVMVRVRGGT